MTTIQASGAPSDSASFAAGCRFRKALRRRTAPPSAASVTDAIELLRPSELGPRLRPLRVVDTRVASVVAAGGLRRLPEVDRVEELGVSAERVFDRVDQLVTALAERVRDLLARVHV